MPNDPTIQPETIELVSRPPAELEAMALHPAAWTWWCDLQLANHRLAVVAEDRRTQYLLRTVAGEEILAECTSELLRDARKGKTLRPVVGDWVAYLPGKAPVKVSAVAPRRSAFTRKRAGEAAREQVVAANIDIVFIVSSIVGDFNVRRLERYLSLTFEAGVRPILLLSKIDQFDGWKELLPIIADAAPGVQVIGFSALTGEGLPEIAHAAQGQQVSAFLGSSGVGKSTLLNHLMGADCRAVGEVRRDGKGRHTTSTRHLLELPSSGFVIDTPGMRELGVWAAQAGIQETFHEVAAAAQDCRYPDCRHDREPDCAVRAGLESGALPEQRVAAYLNLLQETRALEEAASGKSKTEGERGSRGGRNNPRPGAKARRGS